MTQQRFNPLHQHSWMMKLACGLLHVYRGVISPLLMPACRFYPSCSHYALDALRHHGLLRGGWYTFRRLLHCQPWGGQGYDPVPLLNDKLIKRKK